MSVSLLPPLNTRKTSTSSQTPNPNSNTLHPYSLDTPTIQGQGEGMNTPIPHPSMSEGEDGYATVEGVIVWEGGVGELDISGVAEKDEGLLGAGGRVILKGEEGWDVVYKGQVPVGMSLAPHHSVSLDLRKDMISLLMYLLHHI